MNILILFYLFILFVICGNIIFGKERTLNFPNSQIEDIIRVRYFTNAAGVVLYVENTLLVIQKFKPFKTMKLRLCLAPTLCIWNKILWDGCSNIRNNVTNGKGVGIFVSEFKNVRSILEYFSLVFSVKSSKYPNTAVLLNSKQRPGWKNAFINEVYEKLELVTGGKSLSFTCHKAQPKPLQKHWNKNHGNDWCVPRSGSPRRRHLCHIHCRPHCWKLGEF